MLCICTLTVNVTAPVAGSILNTVGIGALQVRLPGQPPQSNTASPGVVILTVNEAVPTLNEWGVLIFMVLLGLISIYYLRRQKVKV